MISRQHEVVFVHIPKTGGQSIEGVFLKALGIAWKDRDQLAMGPNDDPARGPSKLAHLYAREYVEMGHISAGDYQRFTSFAVVRHPFDRIVSEYRYRITARMKKGKPVPDDLYDGFDAFIRKEARNSFGDLARHMARQVDYVTDASGQVIVDHVFHLERLDAEIGPLLKKVFGRDVVLPRSNASKAAEGITVAGMRADQKAYLYNRYRADFEMFGYEA